MFQLQEQLNWHLEQTQTIQAGSVILDLSSSEVLFFFLRILVIPRGSYNLNVS